MNSTIGINHLKLSYGPMTLHEFEDAKKDDEIKRNLDSTTIYVIAKRELPFFVIKDIVVHNGRAECLHLLVSNSNCKDAELIIAAKDNRSFFPNGILEMEIFTNQQKETLKQTDPFQAFSFYDQNHQLIMHANFDKLIQLNHNEVFNIRILGDITPLITYEVLYVGQCVNEHIFSRFKSHHALQKILIKEQIIPKDYDKVNDLLLLPLTVLSDTMYSIGDGATDDEIDRYVRLCLGEIIIPEKTISLDCEKALIHAMNPKYNTQKFRSYPSSKDGLFTLNLDCYSYLIDENLILSYGNGGKIYGQTNQYQSIIRILNNEIFEIQSFPVE
jgi:hypothetical protein